ncbi:MAG: alpha/beta hydrolase [Schaedlerella sp.]|nr:alpha/beta hydrolase [Schaedlerella sp.]
MKIQNYYIEEGQGEPLILLHGNGEDHSYFSHQIKYFSRKYRVIAIDTRGHGKSPRGKAPFTIAQFADDLCYFMHDHEIKKAHILGFSDGGNIAMVFAMKYPEMVDCLILNGANLFLRGLKFGVARSIMSDYKKAVARAKEDESAVPEMEMLCLMVKDPDLKAKDLEKIQARTLVIAGTKDLIKASHTKRIYNHIEDAELVFVGGDHWVADRKYWRFNMAVERFLDENY